VREVYLELCGWREWYVSLSVSLLVNRPAIAPVLYVIRCKFEVYRRHISKIIIQEILLNLILAYIIMMMMMMIIIIIIIIIF
jgi:hypothetical protein